MKFYSRKNGGKFRENGQTVDTKRLYLRTEHEIKGIFCGGELLDSASDASHPGTTIDLV